MDFWCHASALFALSWARSCDSDLIKRRMLVARCAAAVRSAGSAQRFHRAHRETPWRAASALASALSLGSCSYTACSSRLDESRCHSLPTLILLLALALILTASSLATASPRPHPTLVAHSLTFTSTPAPAPARSPSPHPLRAQMSAAWREVARLVRSATPLCRMPIGRGRSAREGVIWSAGLQRALRQHLADLRAEVSAGACAGGSRNPGRWAGNSARETAAGRAVRATIDRPPRLPPEAWSRSCLKRRPDRPRASSQAPPRRFTSNSFRAHKTTLALTLT